MNKLKKFTAVIIAATLALVCCMIPVSASSLDKASKKVESGKTYKKTFEVNDSYYYKLSLSKKGTLEWKIIFEADAFSYYIYDENGSQIRFGVGTGNPYNFYSGKIEGAMELDKGVYFFQIIRSASSNGSGDVKYTFTFPADKTDETISSSDSITIYLEKGDKLQLGALIGNKDVNAAWSSSDKKIAKVSSKGLVTAVSKGKATITAKSGGKSVSVIIIVED